MADKYIKLKRNKNPKGKLSPSGLSPKPVDGGSIATKGIAQYSNPGGSVSISKFNHATGDATGVGTSGTGGTSAGATSGTCESLHETFMTRQAVEEARLYIARCCNIPIASVQIYPDGRFHIYNIRQSDANLIKNALSRSSKVQHVVMSAGSYDFQHFDHMLQPTQKQNISGQYIPDSQEATQLEEGTLDALKDVGKAAVSMPGDAIGQLKGFKNQLKDELTFKSKVAKFLIQAMRDHKSVLFIFDGYGSITSTQKLKNWVETCCGKFVHAYAGKAEICGNMPREEALKILNAYIKETKGPFNGKNPTTFEEFCKLFLDYLKNGAANGDFGQDTPAENILRRFYPNFGLGDVDDIAMAAVLYGLFLTAKDNTDKRGFQNFYLIVRNILLEKKTNFDTNNNIKLSGEVFVSQLERTVKSATTTVVNTNKKSQLDPQLQDDIKYGRRVVLLVTAEEEKELEKIKELNELFKKCTRVLLNDEELRVLDDSDNLQKYDITDQKQIADNRRQLTMDPNTDPNIIDVDYTEV